MTDVLKSVLFLNIIVLDAREGVKQKVRDKIDKTNMPQPLKDAAKKIGAKAASKMATPSTIASKMSQEMPKKMPLEMAEKGMEVEAETVFQEGPYVVVQMQVKRINSVMMAEVKALQHEEQKYDWIVRLLTWFLQLLGAKNQRRLEEEFLPRVVQRKLEPLMDKMLKVKMEEEMKMQAETMVLSEDKQARFFFRKLKQVRAEAKASSRGWGPDTSTTKTD